MKKTELVEKIAKEHNMTKAEANRVVANIFNTIQNCMINGEEVVIANFGTFGTKECPERMVRNPQNNEMVRVNKHRKPVLRFSSVIKNAVR